MKCLNCSVRNICLEEGRDPSRCKEYRRDNTAKRALNAEKAMSTQTMSRLEEVSEVVEQLSVELDDLLENTKEADNKQRVKAAVTALGIIKEMVAGYKPYEER